MKMSPTDPEALAMAVVVEQFKLRRLEAATTPELRAKGLELHRLAVEMLTLLVTIMRMVEGGDTYILSPLERACYDDLLASTFGLNRAPRRGSVHQHFELYYGVKVRRVMSGDFVAIEMGPFSRHQPGFTPPRYRPRL